MKKYFLTIFAMILPFTLMGGTPLCCKGRVDVGPVYLHINDLVNGKRVKSYDIYGVRSDSTLLFFEGSGLCFRPTITYGDKDAKFFAYGLGVGYYIPIGDNWYVIPVIGGSFTNFSTTLDIQTEVGLLPNVYEWIHSKSVYFGGEVGYKLWCDLWISVNYQYAFARSQTNLHFETGGGRTLKGDSSGSNLSVSLDYYWKCWSFGIAGGYNRSLSKEKYGIEGYGGKLSIGYCL